MATDYASGGGDDDAPDTMARRKSNTTTRVFTDGSIRFTPPYTKAEADYRTDEDPDFDTSHDRCQDCVHYIPGGGCHLVQGEIDPEYYCGEFFADYGVFAHDHGSYVEVNSELYGSALDIEDFDIRDFVDEIEERLQQRMRDATADD